MDSNEKDQIVAQFLLVTSLEDRSLAVEALDRASWNLEVAVNRFLEFGIEPEGSSNTDGQAGPAPTDGLRHRATRNNMGNEAERAAQASEDSPAQDGEEIGVWGYIVKILLLPLRLLSALQYVPVLGSVLSVGWTFLRTLVPNLGGDPARNLPESGVLRRAIADAVAEVKPAKFEGSLKEAAQHAKQELKFLLVFLHNNTNADSERFFKEVFLSPDFASFVDGNLILWAESTADQRGYLGCRQLRVNSLPALAMISLVDGQMRIVWQHSGFLPCAELLAVLAMKMELYQPQLIAEETERATLVADRQIVQSQDADFEKSQRIDRAKAAEKKAREEAEAQAIQQQKADEEEQARRQAQRQIDLEEKRQRLPPPPVAGEPNTVRLRFQYPTGKFSDRAFRTAEAVQVLYDFVDTTEDNGISGNFSLFMNAPRRELKTLTDTLANAGLDGGRQKIYIQDHDA
eukprot:m.648975 g.648975  ORF g.648975 m.648975 type:complete len:459 (+) comp22665_c0_seq6:118-1494(+)